MDDQEKELIMKLRMEFLSDPEDELEKIVRLVNQIGSDSSAINDIKSILHNLKGGAQSVGLINLVHYFHQLEDCLEEIDLSNGESTVKKLISHFEKITSCLVDHFEQLKRESIDCTGQSYHLEEMIFYFSKFAKEQTESASNDSWGMEESSEENSEGWGMFEEATDEESPSTKDEGWGFFDDEPQEVKTEEPAQWGVFEEQPSSQAISKTENAPQESAARDEQNNTPPKNENPETIEFQQYLICRQQEQKYAVKVDLVQEVIENVAVQKLPIQRSGLNGVVAVRGQVIPILDLQKFIGSSDSKTRCTIICQHKNKVAGFQMDEATNVLTISAKSIQKTDKSEEKSSNKVIDKVTKIKDDSLLILDIERLLS